MENGKENTLDSLRDTLFDQLKALRSADANAIDKEIERAKAVVQVSGAIVDTAKVELQFLDQVGDERMPPFVNPQRAAAFFAEGDPRFNGGRKGLGTGKELGGVRGS
jgi:hypothetical protein